MLMKMRNTMRKKVSRRTAIKTIGSLSVTLRGINRGNSNASAVSDVNNTFEADDSGYNGSGKAVDLGTCITQYDAEAESGSQDYWKIQFEAVSNAQARDIDNDLRFDGLLQNDSKLTSSHDKWNINDTKYWAGGGEWNKDSDDDYSHAKKAAENALGLIPYVGNTKSALELVYNLLASYFEFGGDNSALFDRKYDWGNEVETWASTKQAEIYNRFDAECDPGERGGFTLKESAAGKYQSDFFDANNEFLVNFKAPEYSPSSISTMTSSEREQKGIKKVSVNDLKKKPRKYGKNKKEIESMNGNYIYRAPVEVTVKINHR